MHIVFLSAATAIIIPILFAVLCNSSETYESDSEYNPCVTVEPVPVDETWYKEVGKTKGFYIPIHSNCNNCKPHHEWSWMSGRKSDKKICWTMSLVTKWGDFNLPWDCEYSAIQSQRCEIQISTGSKLENKFSMAGRVIMTKTDNSTYIAGTICVFGKENVWWVLSTKSKLGDKIKNKIKKHFKELGFKSDNVADPKDEKYSPIILKKIKLGKCPGVQDKDYNGDELED